MRVFLKTLRINSWIKYCGIDSRNWDILLKENLKTSNNPDYYLNSTHFILFSKSDTLKLYIFWGAKVIRWNSENLVKLWSGLILNLNILSKPFHYVPT